MCVCVCVSTDISGSPVSVDVGLCRSHCGGASRPSHEAGQQEYSKHSSMLEFLRSKKVSEVPQRATRARCSVAFVIRVVLLKFQKKIYLIM